MSYPISVNDLAERAYANAKLKGFWKASDDVPTKLMLIVTEVAEAMESYRSADPIGFTAILADGKPHGFRYELADIIIRVLDLAERWDLNIEQAIYDKMAYNLTRPARHGKMV